MIAQQVDLTDISQLAALGALKVVVLDGLRNLENYSFLLAMPQLEHISLYANFISTMPDLSRLFNLQRLDLRGNKIVDCGFLEGLTNLELLKLADNQIADCGFLKGLTNLKSLNLAYNKIADTSFLEGLINLQSLNLRDNQIVDSGFLQGLTNLQSLDLGQNQIVDCSSLHGLTNLQSLDLGQNQIADCSSLEGLVNLQSLNLRRNRIVDFSFLEGLINLTSLDLGYNQVVDCSSLEELINLTSLDLGYNQVVDCSSLEGLINLTSLDLGYNQVVDCSSLEGLTNLQLLNLSGSQTVDQSSLEGLTNLTSLHLSNSQVVELGFLEGLINLESLFLRYNRVVDVSVLKGLANLEWLSLGDNQIVDCSFLEGLTNLTRLSLQSNKIQDISPINGLLQKGIDIHLTNRFEDIEIGENPLQNPPINIVAEGREAVLEWFEQVDEYGIAPLYEGKVMVLGQGDAGKTTFTKLQKDPGHVVKAGKEKSTLGISINKGKTFKHQEVDAVDINALLWDFGGQNIQKMLHQFFITENCLYVIVHDRRRESTQFDYWFQIIDLLGPNSPVIVLENPIDTDSANESFALNKYRELFPKLQIEAIEVNLKYTRGKCKEEWQLLNKKISQQLSLLEIVNRPVPTKWTLMRKALDALDSKYITKDAYYTLCASKEIELPKRHADLCLFYFHELGDLVHFDDLQLDNYIFLDHNWLTQGVYYILADKSIQANGGGFTRVQAYECWDKEGYNEAEKTMLLNLLLKDRFDICYEIGKTGQFISPLLLANDKPKETWPHKTAVHFRYQYGFMPHGMFSRFMVKLSDKIEPDKQWKTGMWLAHEHNGHQIAAEVQMLNDPDTNQQVIDIKLSGAKEGCKELLDYIRTGLDGLHQEFQNIKVRPMAGCNCETCLERMGNREKPSFYDFNKLKTKIVDQRYTEECGNANHQPINIGQILSDIVLEDAADGHKDRVLLHELKEMGMSINQIKNENRIEMSDFGKSSSESSSSAESKSEATNTVNIEINNLLGETQNLKEDIEDERDLLRQRELSDVDIDLVLKDVEKAEKAIAAIETSQKKDEMPEARSKKRLAGFIDDLQKEDSLLRKTLKTLRRGRDYGVGLAEGYNKIAENFGLNPVPALALKALKLL